jgi:predicted PurR-regulated permease PerM
VEEPGPDDAPEVMEPDEAPRLHPDVMPAWVPRAIALFFAAATGLLVARWMLAELQSFLVIVVVALFLSFALEPAVTWLSSHGVRRGLATGMVMVGGFLAFVGFMVLLGSVLFGQVSEFIEDLPDRVERIEVELNERFDLELDTQELINELEDQDVQDLATSLAGSAVQLGMSAVGVVFSMFTVFLFTFYMVADGPRFRRSVLSFLARGRQEQVLQGWELAIAKTGGYIYSRGLLALLSAITTTIALELLGVPYSLALGLWTGIISQFIPTIGTYLAGALPVLVALVDDPTEALFVLIFLIVYQQVENYYFAPKITARTMDLHPAVAFGTVIAGAALFGGVGALLALPASAVMQAIASTYLERHEVIDTAMTRDHRSARGAGGDDGEDDGPGIFRRMAGRS